MVLAPVSDTQAYAAMTAIIVARTKKKSIETPCVASNSNLTVGHLLFGMRLRLDKNDAISKKNQKKVIYLKLYKTMGYKVF